MSNQTPKPMKKVHRNIFHKVGKKLEQTLVVPSSNLSRQFDSTSDLSTHSYRHEDQDDSLSLQYFPQTQTDSPRIESHPKTGIIHLFLTQNFV